MRVEFSAVRLIPIAAVLARYKIETRKRNNTELVANCPFESHKGASKQHTWTLAISTHKNKWYCHSDTCRAAGNHPKGGDVIDLVCRIENVTALDAAKKLAELFCIGQNGHTPPSKLLSAGIQTGDVRIQSPQDVNKPLAFTLKDIDPDHPFIRERGISLETAMEFGVGFFPGKGSMAGRIVFPLYEVLQGNLLIVGYAGRSVDGSEPRWKLPPGLVKSFLYGLEKCEPGKLLHLTESPWGVLHLFQHGVQAAALLGSSLTEAQEALLEPYGEIRICMDNDAAGREAAAKIADRLRAKHKVSKAYLLER